MNNTKSKTLLRILLLAFILCALVGCSFTPGAGIDTGTASVTEEAGDHEEITRELITMVGQNAELRTLLETAIAQASALNPDPDTNPVHDLASYYSFIDRCSRCMPWEICPSEKFDSLYGRIDQGMGCLYFILDQPLEELQDEGYYHNSLMYHEPVRSWFRRFLQDMGSFLNTEASWTHEYYLNALANPDFQLQEDLYESPDNWKCFNDFFARKLKDPDKRPAAAPDDESVVTSPADSVPQGFWEIDGNSIVIADEPDEQEGLRIKTGTLRDVSVLLGNSEYADAFRNGALTHTFLDINDYHRYHFPVSGTVREVTLIPQDDAPGGVITWDKEEGRYKEYFSEQFGWQSIETRGVVIVETDGGGFVAIVPVGMCQVSSVNFEESIVPGARVRKGDPLGYFLFGGSDIIMLFSEDLDFTLTAEAGNHILTGGKYGRIAGN